MTRLVTTSDGTRLAVQEWGSGRPVVLCHAWALRGRMWDPQVAALVAAGLRPVVIDRRGHGGSDVPPTGYDLDRLAADVHEVMEALDLRDAVLVGHSAGAQEVLRLVTAHGAARVAGLVLSAPITPCILQRDDAPFGVPEEVFEAQRQAWTIDVGAWVDENAAPYFGTAQVSQSLQDATKRMLVDTSLPVVLETHRTLSRADLRPDLTAVADLALPVTIVQGTLDASAPIEATGRVTAAMLPTSRLVEIDGGGHGLYLGHAAEYTQVLLDACAAAAR